MSDPLILASTSSVRKALLQAAGLTFQAVAPRVDEEMIKASLLAEQASARDIADALAEMKARRVADHHPDAVVLGCDQVLEFQGRIWGKPASLDEARAQLRQLRGNTHRLLSALVIWHKGQPVWRHVGTARLTMRDFGDSYLDGYLQRNWPGIGHSVGAYKLEEEGIRLFSAIEGDHFTILGLPLLPLLSYLGLRGFIES